MAGSPDFSKVSLSTLQEIVRQAEVYLGAQLTASIAADQRAIAFASALAAAAVVLVGAGLALLIAEKPNPELGWTAISTAVGFLVAMAFANFSAMPAVFWFAGNSPERWNDDVHSKQSLQVSLAQQLSHYSDMIADNDRLMRRNSRQMLAAIWIAWGTLVTASTVAIYLIACG